MKLSTLLASSMFGGVQIDIMKNTAWGWQPVGRIDTTEARVHDGKVTMVVKTAPHRKQISFTAADVDLPGNVVLGYTLAIREEVIGDPQERDELLKYVQGDSIYLRPSQKAIPPGGEVTETDVRFGFDLDLTRFQSTAEGAQKNESELSPVVEDWKEEALRKATPYCLACEKEGHRTNECHSTSGFNTPRDMEISRLAWIANKQNNS